MQKYANNIMAVLDVICLKDVVRKYENGQGLVKAKVVNCSTRNIVCKLSLLRFRFKELVLGMALLTEY